MLPTPTINPTDFNKMKLLIYTFLHMVTEVTMIFNSHQAFHTLIIIGSEFCVSTLKVS